MFPALSSNRSPALVLALLFIFLPLQLAAAQGEDPANGETDPIKLFERGQDAHAKNDYQKAIGLYDAAIKIKPEFPEAEFQRAIALLAISQNAEAIEGFNRAVKLRPDWAIAYAKFGTMLASQGTARDAEPILRKAIKLNDQSLEATVALATLLQHNGLYPEALKLIRLATSFRDATAQTWQQRAFIEVGAGDNAAALSSITQAVQLDPANPAVRSDRARLLLLRDRVAALADLDIAKQSLTPATPGKQLGVIFEVARLYALAGKSEEALKLIDALDANTRKEPSFVELRAEIAADLGSNAPEDLQALEQIAQRDPKNARVLARLGEGYRRIDPAKSQAYYLRALQIEPDNAKFATGYAAALIQARRFAEAATVLQRVINKTPDDYTAHANFALALYELKRFAEAIPEYEWLAKTRPEIAATYFFIATAHDNLGEYPQALDAYQRFLSHADPTNNKLEIEKVNLRLPTLRAQIQRGQGAKRKTP